MTSSNSSPKEVEQFRRALENPLRAYEKIQIEGKKPVIGYFTELVPVELIHSVNSHPGRLFPYPTSDYSVDSLVQTYCCSYLRNFLSYALHDGLENALSAIIFTDNFCDSLQNTIDIFQHAFPDFPLVILNQPVSAASPNAQSFCFAEFKTLLKELQRITESFPDERKIRASMMAYEGVRKTLSRLETAYLSSYSDIAFSDFMACLAGRELFPLGDYRVLLEGILEQWNSNGKCDKIDHPRVLVVGGMFQNLEIFDVIEEAGSSIVGELLLFGHKDYEMQFSPLGEALESLSKAYINKIPSSTRYDFSIKTQKLLKLVKERNVDGVIHLNYSFCDPEAFERVIIKNSLEKANVPFLMIETDPSVSNIEQIKTRTQAFVEILEG